MDEGGRRRACGPRPPSGSRSWYIETMFQLRLSSLALLGVLSTSVLAEGDPAALALRRSGTLSPELDAIVRSPRYVSARWGLEVVDLESGEVIYELDPTEKFLTGSTAKIFSVTAALATFGADYRFETPVVHTGKQGADGVLAGDLILRAAGDLTLGGRTRADGTVDIPIFDHYDANVLPGMATLTPEDPLAGLDELARKVRAAGVVRVTGEVLVDDRLWEPVELDEVPISPMVVNDNLVDFLVTPGAFVGAPATFDWRPKTAAYAPDVQVTTGEAGSRIAVEVSAPLPGKIVLRGSIPAGAAPLVQTYQVPDPATFARTLFIEALARAGVQVAANPLGANPAQRLPAPRQAAALPTLATFVSPPFSEYARLINKVSHNLGANLLPLLLAVHGGRRTLDDGMRIEREFVRSAGLRRRFFTLVDGQGLPGNAVAPRGQTQYLRFLARRPDFGTFFDSTPILGVDGSLATVIPPDDPARGHVHAKTGTLATQRADGQLLLQTKALAGYIDSAGGRRLAFALYLNDLPISSIDDVIEANNTLGHMASLIYRAQ